jgi:hypothetical protein
MRPTKKRLRPLFRFWGRVLPEYRRLLRTCPKSGWRQRPCGLRQQGCCRCGRRHGCPSLHTRYEPPSAAAGVQAPGSEASCPCRSAIFPVMREFSRIKSSAPLRLQHHRELKMAARRRGEDIIDMSMGNPGRPDAAAHHRQAGRGGAAREHARLLDLQGHPAAARRSATGISGATTSASTRRAKRW